MTIGKFKLTDSESLRLLFFGEQLGLRCLAAAVESFDNNDF